MARPWWKKITSILRGKRPVSLPPIVKGEALIEAAGDEARRGERTRAALLLIQAAQRFEAEGRSRHAAAALKTAQRFGGFHPHYGQLLGQLYARTGENHVAAREFQRAADTAIELGRIDWARQLHIEAHRADPAAPGPWSFMADLAYNAGRLEVCERILAGALQFVGYGADPERGREERARIEDRLAALRSEIASLPPANLLEEEDDATVPISMEQLQGLLSSGAQPSIVLAPAPIPLEVEVDFSPAGRSTVEVPALVVDLVVSSTPNLSA